MGFIQIKAFVAKCDECGKQFPGLFDDQDLLIDELDGESWEVDGAGTSAEIFCNECIEERSDSEKDSELEDKDEDEESDD